MNQQEKVDEVCDTPIKAADRGVQPLQMGAANKPVVPPWEREKIIEEVIANLTAGKLLVKLAPAIAKKYKAPLRKAHRVVYAALRQMDLEVETLRSNLDIAFACTIFRHSQMLQTAMDKEAFSLALEIQKDLNKLLGLYPDQNLKPRPAWTRPRTVKEMTDEELERISQRGRRRKIAKKTNEEESDDLPPPKTSDTMPPPRHDH